MIERKRRKCLRCGEMFNSRGPEHRICGRHGNQTRNKYEAWAEGPAEDWTEAPPDEPDA